MEKQLLSTRHLIIMAVTAGICVSTIYYNQPLLDLLAKSFSVSDKLAGNIAVLTQTGYGVGLFFIIPLGDKVKRKSLILFLQGFLALSLLGMAFSPTLVLAYISSLLIGLTAVAAQVILPLAAALSKPEKKGSNVGFIFTGILIGILAARVFSGYIADLLGWRAVFEIAAGIVVANSLFIYKVLPDKRSQKFDRNYLKLLQSTLYQVKRFFLLRNTAMLGALGFGLFSSFWATLTFYLSRSPFNYSTKQIGLMGLLGVGGALMAPLVGKMADRGKPHKSQFLALSILLLSLVVMAIWPLQLWAVLVVVLLLDVGVQSIQVTNVSLIYTLDEDAHSRINTIYMTAYFIGGAVGSFIGVWCWENWQWKGVTWQLFIMAGLATTVLIWRMLRLKMKAGQ